MIYVVAANEQMFREYLKVFADHNNTFKYVGKDVSIRGAYHDAPVILFENYRDNPNWLDIQQRLNVFTNIYVICRYWLSLDKILILL